MLVQNVTVSAYACIEYRQLTVRGCLRDVKFMEVIEDLGVYTGVA